MLRLAEINDVSLEIAILNTCDSYAEFSFLSAEKGKCRIYLDECLTNSSFFLLKAGLSLLENNFSSL